MGSQGLNLGLGDALNLGWKMGPKLEAGRGLLIDFGDDEDLRELVGEYEARVDYLGTRVGDALGLRALLVRPDGIVAWVVEEGGKVDLGETRGAMGKWFGFSWRLGLKVIYFCVN